MIRRPPRSTLFPYTDALPISAVPGVSGTSQGPSGTFGDVPPGCPPVSDLPSVVPSSIVLIGRNRCRDRKSTRLNSSHLVISYAVFCLKKKNYTYSHYYNARLL